MSEISLSENKRRVLHLVVAGQPVEKVKSVTGADDADIVPLTEANAREVLERIFAADSVAVWGKTD
jgi:hypothetical protein